MASEVSYENGCGGNAVAVVVSVDQYLVMAFHGIADKVDCLLHVIKQKRVIKRGTLVLKKVLPLLFGINSVGL